MSFIILERKSKRNCTQPRNRKLREFSYGIRTSVSLKHCYKACSWDFLVLSQYWEVCELSFFFGILLDTKIKIIKNAKIGK